MGRNSKIAVQERIIARAAEKIDRLERLPHEPTWNNPDKPLVVFFDKTFHVSGRVYSYAAVKASDGLWYTTGPQSVGGYDWDSLIEWIYRGNEDAVVYRASKFTAL